MAGLDRRDICNAVESLLESDSTLYGSTSLINYISDKVTDYEQARVGVDEPYKMYLKAPRKEKIAVRMGNNVDYASVVEYTIVGLKSNPDTALDQIDDIENRIQHLCDNEMWSGGNLTTHFSNNECTIINIEWEGATADTVKEDGGWKVQSEGTIRVEINRIKP